MDDQTRIELEAAAFRTLVAHFRERTDVQNIDMMNLAGFCRNCLYHRANRRYQPEKGAGKRVSYQWPEPKGDFVLLIIVYRHH